jgi:hypothetical protein
LQGRAHFYENGDAGVMARAGGIRLPHARQQFYRTARYAAYGEPLKSLSRPSFARIMAAKHPTPLPSEYVRSILV